MEKTAIRNFAIEARKILMKSAITEAGFYGITKDGCKSPTQKGNDFEVYETVAGTENRIFGDDIKRRASLVKAIGDIGFDQVIEETAYTWFNRIIAIRFMEVNNYLPTRVRVLSSETGSGTPDIISQSDTVELNLSAEELEKIQTAKRENRYDDAFRLLFIKQCNELNDILPGLFEKTDDYMELLLKITYTNDGVIRMLVDSIPESNFNVETEGQVEIIGWMYQYYNTELKDDTFAKLKKNVKITKERIPAATQLFTPDWIVRYMVENSLGRVWIEHLRAVDPSVDEKAKAEEFGWKYYLPEAEQEEDVAAQLVEIRKSYKDLTPQDITCIDPCMGSGHILVYMFDVLMDIYRSEGFSEREAVFDILEKNIRGLDIDRRAYQLSYFALMMKARGYNRIFFRGHEDIDGNRVQAVPRVYAIEESNSIERDQLQYYGAGLDEMQKNNAINQMNGLLDTLHDAKEYGSILNVENYDWKLLHSFVEEIDNNGQMSLVGFVAGRSQNLLSKLVDIGETLARKYDAVVTNPPYMGSSNMNAVLLEYVKREYALSKTDISTVFIEKMLNMSSASGYISLINIPTWMSLMSFDELRLKIVRNSLFISMLHLGRGIFGSDFGTVSFVLRNLYCKDYKAIYKRLFRKSSLVDSVETKEKMYFENNGIYVAKQDGFLKMDGCPIAYWIKPVTLGIFESATKVKEIGSPRQGFASGDNNRFFRLWNEVEFSKVGIGVNGTEEIDGRNLLYVPHNKGGEFRKWYGNISYVVKFDKHNREILSQQGNHLPSRNYYFKTGFTWSDLTIGDFAARYIDCGATFDTCGPTFFSNTDNLEDVKYVLGYFNSKVFDHIVKIYCSGIHYSNGVIATLPCLMDKNIREQVIKLVEENIANAKADWMSHEMSFGFEKHPLITGKNLDIAFSEWKFICKERFERTKKNEEKINRLFIDLYGLQDELMPEVEDKDITIYIADIAKDIRSLISYAVGCMFGRYSLANPGLVYAGGEFDNSLYGNFPADVDAIIPITDEAYFNDDIVGRFEEFIRVVYGADSLEANLKYIADALGVKGNTPREAIRTYFLNDFYKDHCNMYSVTGSGKRPIYWLFDSGKQNGFKCLIYMHRYTPDMVGLIRSDYLTKAQGMIENALKNAEYAINTSGSAVDRAQATKKRDKYIKQLAEIRAYYPALSHIALQRINLDLDDGVKANYEKFQNIEVSIEGEKKQKVDLLAKI